METKTLYVVQSSPGDLQLQMEDEGVGCSVGIMAYNEEANIGRTLRAVLEQQGSCVCIKEVIVIASGCTDRTIPIVSEIALQDPRVQLCIQEKREGKASAINLFLKQASCPIVVLLGADTIPESLALDYLCVHFNDPKIGMVGGRPIPINDPSTFMGHAVQLLWLLHDRLARVHPKLGEVIAFRNIISGIPVDSPVDEISIQAMLSQLGYQLIYEPTCIVYNKGPLTIRDFLKQRRRIYAGHLQTRTRQNYEAVTMKVGPIFGHVIACRDFTFGTPKQAMWTLGTIFLEGFARLQGYFDYIRKRDHHIWEMVDTTKNLEAGKQKVRRICHAQSVIVFRLILEDDSRYDLSQERKEREASVIARKLLPILRTKIRKSDKLSISGPGILTVVIRAEQHGAELVIKRIQNAVQTTPIRMGMRGQEVNCTVAYSSLTFTTTNKEEVFTNEA